ncbi:MAG: Lnb N-terminal periplasmic domain-containing protein [Flavisolibacter sp.]
MKKILFLFSFSFLLSQFLFAQDSCSLRISLLTCAPGEELYSTFGHTALRVRDEARGADFVFNYGTFEFAPDFYVKFIRGKLLYSLAVEDFNEFMYEYRMESRTVQEQVLQLSCEEKQKLFTALQNNAKDENRYYKYDFLFDNCTTRAGNIVAANTDTPVIFNNILAGKHPSFRDLIHSYLDAGNEYWSKLGIDMLLGAKLDRKVTNREAMFLPEYLLKGFDSASIGGRPWSLLPRLFCRCPRL